MKVTYLEPITRPLPLTSIETPKPACHYKKPDNFFEFEQTTITGEKLYMSKFAGKKAILVVNVASKSINSVENYTWMAEMKRKFPELEIVTYPCD